MPLTRRYKLYVDGMDHLVACNVERIRVESGLVEVYSFTPEFNTYLSMIIKLGDGQKVYLELEGRRS